MATSNTSKAAYLDQFEGIIFDLDGTLADSMWAWDNICRSWCLARGFTPPQNLEETIALMTLTQSAEYVIQLYRLPESPSQIIDQWTAMVRDTYLERVPLKEGARELLQRLHSQGKQIALATSCFQEICEAFLDKHGIRPYFHIVFYTDQVGRDKTHPDIYLACAKALDIPASSCAVFEDILPALEGVRAAGMAFVAVHDAACKDWDILSTKADMAIQSFCQLM